MWSSSSRPTPTSPCSTSTTKASTQPLQATTCTHYFDPAVSGRLDDGRGAFEFHAAAELGSVIFLTATVYRTSLVHEAQRRWTGDSARLGPRRLLDRIRLRPRPHLHQTRDLDGVRRWAEPLAVRGGAWTRAVYEDIPKVFLALEKEGYPPRFCRAPRP